MLSLYDYLGRAAGKELGLSVAKYAYRQKSKVEKRIVSNPVYTGEVNLYTESLLLAYFNNPNHRDTINQDKEYYQNKKQHKKSLERKVSEKQINTLPF